MADLLCDPKEPVFAVAVRVEGLRQKRD